MKVHQCVVCPIGCRLQVEVNGTDVRVSQHQCSRGRPYAQREALAPERILTTTLATRWGQPLPVRTQAPIAKDRLLDIQRRLACVMLDTPVHAGDTVLADVDGSGTALVATSDGQPPE